MSAACQKLNTFFPKGNFIQHGCRVGLTATHMSAACPALTHSEQFTAATHACPEVPGSSEGT
eukprot:3674840-Amphidinium_carterae.1